MIRWVNPIGTRLLLFQIRPKAFYLGDLFYLPMFMAAQSNQLLFYAYETDFLFTVNSHTLIKVYWGCPFLIMLWRKAHICTQNIQRTEVLVKSVVNCGSVEPTV